jgi:hypothetical protein
MSDARYPVFDKDGKYLYFAASTDAGPALQPDVGSFSRQTSKNIYFAVLSKAQASPLSPESDEEKLADEKKPEDKKADTQKPPTDDQKREGGSKGEAPKPEVAKTPDVKIDFENIGQRILALPIPPRRYMNLQVGKMGVLYAVEAPQPAPGVPFSATVHRFDLKRNGVNARERVCGAPVFPDGTSQSNVSRTPYLGRERHRSGMPTLRPSGGVSRLQFSLAQHFRELRFLRRIRWVFERYPVAVRVREVGVHNPFPTCGSDAPIPRDIMSW